MTPQASPDEKEEYPYNGLELDQLGHIVGGQLGEWMREFRKTC